MCRLILARGAFRSDEIVDAALAMSMGLTADHERPVEAHPHGWGALWRDPGSADGLGVHRDERAMVDSVQESPVPSVRSDFLAVHARRASLAHQRGPRFVHPLERREAGFAWYFMHNGFLPTVHQRLGLPGSDFDTAEYFEYIVPKGRRTIDVDEARSRLRAMPPGGLAANAIAVNDENAYVIHWMYEPNPYPRYFGMHQLVRPECLIVASEVIPSLGPPDEWEPLKPEQIMEIPLKGEVELT
jgi:predicted glutamine amidotransferase